MNSIASAYLAQGRYAEALEQFDVAAAIPRTLGDRGGEGAALNNIGVVYRAQGRYAEALAQYEAALAIWRELGDRAGEGATLTSIGDVYDALGQDDEALDRYEAALVLLRAVHDRVGEGTALNNVGKAYRALGRYEEALAQYEAALALLREGGDRKVEGTTLNNIGGVYRAQGRYAEALAQFEAALAIRREVGDRSGEGTTLNNIGLVYEAQGNYAEALASYTQAIVLFEAVRAEAGSEARVPASSPNGAKCMTRSSACSFGRTRRLTPFSRPNAAGRVPCSIRWPPVTSNSSTMLPPACLPTRPRPMPCVYPPKMPWRGRRRSLPRDPQLVTDLEQQLAAAESAYTKARAAIESRRGQLSSLVPGRSNNVLSLRAVQKLLDGETTLVSYWMLGDHAVAFVVTAAEFTVVELPDATAGNIGAALENLYQWSNKENPHPRPLRNLYKWLVEPLAEHLQTPHVAIVPHQALHTVPFAALTDGQRYFGQEHTLTLLPSASALRFLGDNARKAVRSDHPTAVVLGNPQIDLPDLAALPFAEAEAEAVGALLDTAVYTGAQASELQLRDGRERHGHPPSRRPRQLRQRQPALQRHRPGGRGRPGRSAGDPRDLRPAVGRQRAGGAERLRDECRPALAGDEVVGLTRAFFFAGAPAVIASLWNVNDEATQALMVSFYRHWLKTG